MLIIIAVIVAAPWVRHAASSPPPPPSLASCSTWAPNSVQKITVDGFAHFGAAEGCGVQLINVSVTFFALPQSTIVLDGWSMRGGGYVALQGPPSAPWSIRDVTVAVTNSVIEASAGPAVSVVLGSGHNASASDGDGVALRNVSLYCSGSRLWSVASGPATSAASASVLSVTLAWTLDAYAPNVTIDQLTVVAIDSDLRSEVTAPTANATAAVVSIAAARYVGDSEGYSARVTVSSSVLYVLRCNATAAVIRGSAGALPTEAASVSAVAGVAFGKLAAVGLTLTSTTVAVLHSRALSTATVVSRLNAYAASNVAGVAVGLASSNSPVTIANRTTLYLAWSNCSSSSTSTSTNINYAASGSSVAGVAVGMAQSNSPVTIAESATLFVGWSNATGGPSQLSTFSGSPSCSCSPTWTALAPLPPPRQS